MKGSSSYDKWLGRLSKQTARVHGYTFKSFMVWLKENGAEFSNYLPDDLVDYQQNANNSDRYKILDLIQGYVSSKKGRASTKARDYSSIRSFFLHNRAELPRDASFSIRSKVLPVQGNLTIEELKEIILSSKPAYQAIFLSMFQGGMGLSEFNYWNLNGWQSLQKALNKNRDIIRIDLPGRKQKLNIRPFYTFIGPDAIDKIIIWFSHRPLNAKAIFTNQFGDPVTANSIQLYWIRHQKKLGIIEPKNNGYSGNRYGKNPHEIRDLFRSQWEKSPARASVAEFMMGHEIDALHYNKAYRDESWAQSEYEKALPRLNIMSDERAFGKIDENEVRNLQKLVRELEKQLETRNDQINVLENDFRKLEKEFEERLKKRVKEELYEIIGPPPGTPESAEWFLRKQSEYERESIERTKQLIERLKKEGKDVTDLERDVEDRERWLRIQEQINENIGP